MEKIIEESNDILRELDTLDFIKKPREGDEQFSYDSWKKDPKGKTIYGIDDPFIKTMKEQVQVLKEKYGRGMLIPVHRHNESLITDKLIKLMKGGLKVCLISDAGTPTISDPGYSLVNIALKENLEVIGVAGPSSIDVGLSNSGFPQDKYIFAGFLPKTTFYREETLKKLKNAGKTAILFEGKHRITKTLASIANIYGDNQQIYLGVELTKMYERNIRGKVRDILDELSVNEKLAMPVLKGEVTCVISPFCSNENEYEEVLLEEETKLEERKNERYRISNYDLMQILKRNLDLSTKELSQIGADISGENKTKMYDILTDLKFDKAKKTKRILKDIGFQDFEFEKVNKNEEIDPLEIAKLLKNTEASKQADEEKKRSKVKRKLKRRKKNNLN